MYKFKLNNTSKQCKIYRVYRSASMPDKLLGTVYPDGTAKLEDNVRWIPVARALVELGVMSEEDAIMKELGY